MSDLEAAFAFLARREGKPTATAARWSHLLSFELGWMNPGQARAFVSRAVAAGLLAADGEQLRFVLDPAGIQVPRGFRPDPDALPAAAPPTAPAPQPDLFLGWVARLAAHQGRRPRRPSSCWRGSRGSTSRTRRARPRPRCGAGASPRPSRGAAAARGPAGSR